MRHGFLGSAIVALGLTIVSASPLFAQPQQTSLSGAISGRELCEQAVCGSAIFVAAFAGQIDHRLAAGLAIGSIRHTSPLPTNSNEPCAIINGGSWSISTLRGTLAGSVEPGGTVCSKDNNQFTVTMTMNIDQGGDGQAQLIATLDHGPFPPTIKGFIGQ
jgi:hypothetical protein